MTQEINNSLSQISSILGIVGFFLAVYTSLPTITKSYTNYSKKKLHKQLNRIDKSISEHDLLNENTHYLITRSFKSATYILIPILFSLVFSSVTFNIFEITIASSILMIPLAWIAGYGTGLIFRSYRFVSDREKSLQKLIGNKEKILDKLKKYEAEADSNIHQ